MDPDNLSAEAVLRVTDWLRGIWEMRRANALPVQQWVDSIPSTKIITEHCDESVAAQSSDEPQTALVQTSQRVKEPNMTVSVSVPNSPAIMPGKLCPNTKLPRDLSVQSDSSHCSSVESLLELRRADPEAILLSLGFGGSPNSPQDNGPLARIPKRFLKPSNLKGIDINEFIRHQQATNESLDSASLGYRGLTGSPYVAPSEIVQKIMERLHEHDSHERDGQNNIINEHFKSDNKFSVLSPDNRHFLEQPRSKSPDMRNKRMIIGQKSFVFAKDGELIELQNSTSASIESEEDSEIMDNSSQNDKKGNDSGTNQGDGQTQDQRTDNRPQDVHNRRANLKKQRRITDEDAERYLDSLEQNKSN